MQRPVRPEMERKTGVSRIKHPASTKRVHTKYSKNEIMEFSKTAKDIAPEDR
ncbi:MAG: hypothetical protein KUG78_01450 [Kangiellaceae bacterium]|nr:hypothetical protein [Kangiellaceae bacterium]